MASLVETLLGAKSPVTQWTQRNSNLLTGLGTSLLSDGMNFAPAQQGAMMDRQVAAQKDADAKLAATSNATKTWLAKNYPDLAQAVDAGLPVSDAWQEAFKRQQPGYGQGAAPQNPYMSAGDGQFFNWQTGQYVTNPNAQADLPKPPQNYRWAADGQSLEAIPGGPADTKSGLTDDRKMVATDTILTAADTARKLVDSGVNTGVFGAVMGLNSQSQAAELRRQVDVLKSNASIENLTAMRQASPTGGALGSVTERENAMLASAAGALTPDADAADFKKALDNYELTLLKIVHGPVAGQQIFEATRGGKRLPASSTAGADPDVDSILQQYGVP